MKIAILDDTMPDRETMRNHIERYFGEKTALQKEFDSGETFLAEYIPGTYDLLIIDCYMGTVGGFDVARRVRAAGDCCEIIFYTTSSDFAIEGYQVRAAGYLLKPVTYEAFATQMDLLKKKACPPAILLNTGKINHKLLVDQILWGEAQGHYLDVHTLNNGTLHIRYSYGQIAELLSPYSQFYSCYRGCLVNLDQVKTAIKRDFILYNGDRVPIRQKDASMAVNVYADYLFEKQRRMQP